MLKIESFNNEKPLNVDEIDLKDFDLKITDETDISRDSLTISSKTNQRIKEIIDEIKFSNNKINEFSQSCLEFICKAEKGTKEVAKNRGFFKRCINRITGKTTETMLQSTQHTINAQKACVQVINEMNKQLLLSQEQILMMQNILNYMITEENDFRNQLKEHLKKMFSAVIKRFQNIEKTILALAKEENNTRQIIKKLQTLYNKQFYYLWNYVHKLNDTQTTLKWVMLIDSYDNDYLKYDNDIIKFFYTISSFFKEKNGDFTLEDLQLFSVALKNLGFNHADKISIKKFVLDFVDVLELKTKLLDKITDEYGISTNIRHWSEKDKSLALQNKTPLLAAISYSVFLSWIHKAEIAEIKSKIINLLENEYNVNVDYKLSWFEIACELFTQKSKIKIDDSFINKTDYDVFFNKYKRNKSIQFVQEEIKNILYIPLRNYIIKQQKIFGFYNHKNFFTEPKLFDENGYGIKIFPIIDVDYIFLNIVSSFENDEFITNITLWILNSDDEFIQNFLDIIKKEIIPEISISEEYNYLICKTIIKLDEEDFSSFTIKLDYIVNFYLDKFGVINYEK